MFRREFLAGAVLALPVYRLARAGASMCAATEGVELGPYYRSGAAQRARLVEPTPSDRPLSVFGRISSAAGCKPLGRALVEVWQADTQGKYDEVRLRALIETGRDGFHFDTIVPGHYANRAQHIHFFVHADDHEPLVTQLYFSGDPRLATDHLVRRTLIRTPTHGKVSFDLVLRPRRPNPPAAIARFGELEGDYETASGPVRLLRRNDALLAIVDGMPDAELLFDDADHFRVVEYGISGKVRRSEDGVIHLDTVDAAGDTSTGHRR